MKCQKMTRFGTTKSSFRTQGCAAAFPSKALEDLSQAVQLSGPSTLFFSSLLSAGEGENLVSHDVHGVSPEEGRDAKHQTNSQHFVENHHECSTQQPARPLQNSMSNKDSSRQYLSSLAAKITGFHRNASACLPHHLDRYVFGCPLR